jgi:hypothetical protein
VIGFAIKWIVLPVVLLAAGFAAGWTVKGWQVGAAARTAEARVLRQAETAGQISVAAATADQAARDQITAETGTIIKELPAHVTPADDARCVVPFGFVRSYDAAATGDLSALSGAAGEPDGAPSGVALSAVATTDVANLGDCRGVARQLTDLEDWLTAERANFNDGTGR